MAKQIEQFRHTYRGGAMFMAAFYRKTYLSDMTPAAGQAVSIDFFKKAEASANDRNYEEVDNPFSGPGGRLWILRPSILTSTKGIPDLAGPNRDYAVWDAINRVLNNLALSITVDDDTFESEQLLCHLMDRLPDILKPNVPAGTENDTTPLVVNGTERDALSRNPGKLFSPPIILDRNRRLGVSIESIGNFTWPNELSGYFLRMEAIGSQWVNMATEIKSVKASSVPQTN